MSGHAANAEDDAGMLQGVIGKIEHCPYAADAWARSLRNHLFEPIRRDNFQVVVEQSDKFTPGFVHAKIVDRGKVEGVGVGQDANGTIAAADIRPAVRFGNLLEVLSG